MELEELFQKKRIENEAQRQALRRLELCGYRTIAAWPKGKACLHWPIQKGRRLKKAVVVSEISKAIGWEWEGIKFVNSTIYLWWPGGD